MNNNFKHISVYAVVSILALTLGIPVYAISTKGTWGVKGQKRMHTPPQYLIIPLHLSRDYLTYIAFSTSILLSILLTLDTDGGHAINLIDKVQSTPQ
jgi:hypothetical protein